MSDIWVTGARGFIGRSTCKYLSMNGFRVVGLGHGSIPPESISKYGLSFWLNGDIHSENLFQLLNFSDLPNIIFHFAGGSSVGVSLDSPYEDFQRSVNSTIQLLEWVRLHSPKTKLVVSSSAAVYGNSYVGSITEDLTLYPYSPYGFHKRIVELICQSYSHNFNLKISIVRLFSVYGPGLQKQLLWDLCCRLRNLPSTILLHGTGLELRDWVYIDDAVQILVKAADQASCNPFIVNGGTGIGTCVLDVASALCQAWCLDPEFIFSGKSKAGDPISLIADTKRLNSFYAAEHVSLSVGIEKYVRWFQELPL